MCVNEFELNGEIYLMVNKVLTREEVPVEMTWDLQSVFLSDEAWNEEFKEIAQLIPEAEKFKGKLVESAKSLYETLQFSDKLSERFKKATHVQLFKA